MILFSEFKIFNLFQSNGVVLFLEFILLSMYFVQGLEKVIG